MHFALPSLVLPLLAVFVEAAPQAPACYSPVVRKEWRTLPKATQLQYISAVKCLQAKPAKFAADWPGARNRFDDFQGLHINQTDFIHFVGHFQAWHRWFVATYEKALCGECGFCSGQPYWDWTKDATPESFVKSPLFDPVYGFGGNGPYDNKTNPALPFRIPEKTGGGCVKDGPFKKMSVNMGPGNSTVYNPRCLTRDFAPTYAAPKVDVKNVKDFLKAKSFGEFDIKVQGGIQPPDFTYHGGGHIGVGGELGTIADVYASPGDPLFFLHHANMDRVWWTWQFADRKVRTKDISGPSVQFTAPWDFFGPKTSPSITLDYVMNVRNFVPGGVKIRDVMDIQQSMLCYDYDKLY